MTLHLTHRLNEAVELFAGEQMLLRYVYRPDTPQLESPKPYFHPLYTLAGNEVTCYRPHDHIWHKGIQMTITHIEGENFWGGNSYIHGQGYVQLPNNGAMVHERWRDVACDGVTARLDEQLTWITQAGERWIDEARQIDVSLTGDASGMWLLDFATSMTNVSGRPLTIGSPTTAGRPMAGYGGLFWRGPRSFLDGEVLAGDDLCGPEVMGQRAPWLAYSGLHDGTNDRSTLIFLDHPANPRYPTKWFVRNTPFACASFAFMFDEELVFEPATTLAFRYRIAVADGAWTREQIETLAANWRMPEQEVHA